MRSLKSEQKGYMNSRAMTSDADEQERARAYAIRRLTTPPERIEAAETKANRQAWNRASEQERRRLLKDCGWL
jgi:hypothetical protein